MSLETGRDAKDRSAGHSRLLARLDSFEKPSNCSLPQGRVVVSGMASPDDSAENSDVIKHRIHPFPAPAEALHATWACSRAATPCCCFLRRETEEIIQLLEALKRWRSAVDATGKMHSTLAEASDVVLDVSVKEEACSLNLAPQRAPPWRWRWASLAVRVGTAKFSS